MQERRIKLPLLFLIAATRGMLGFGAGLLASGHLSAKRRRIAGIGLVTAGIASTIPLALRLFRRRADEPMAEETIDGVIFETTVPIIVAEIVP